MNAAATESADLITAIIPTYRRPRLLRRAMLSVLEQDAAQLRVCICDNASGDDTASVVASLATGDSRLRYHRHAANIGAAANIEYGLRHVETPFFSVLSDDDYLLPGFYARALTGLAAHPQAVFWAGVVLNVDMAGVIWDARVAGWPREGIFTPPDGFMRMTGGMAPAWTGIVFRREVIDLEGLPDPETLGPSDLEYCLRLAVRFPYVVEKQPVAVFTLNDASFSATQPLSSFWPGWKRMMEKFASDEGMNADFRKAALTALRHDAQRMLLRRGANAIAAGRNDFAQDAADALALDCGEKGRAAILRTFSKICASNSVAQRLYTSAYRRAEARIIRSRGALQQKYGSLLRTA